MKLEDVATNLPLSLHEASKSGCSIRPALRPVSPRCRMTFNFILLRSPASFQWGRLMSVAGLWLGLFIVFGVSQG